RELASLPPPSDPPLGLLAAETRAVAEGKKLALLVAGAAFQRFGDDLPHQQEVLAAVSDMVLDLYLAESALLRCRRVPEPAEDWRAAATTLFVNDMVGRLEASTRTVAAALAVGDELRAQLAALRRFTRWTPVDTISLRRQVADAVLARDGYPG